MQFLLWLLVIVLVCLGFLGTILPALPGAPLIFLGTLLAAWINDFNYISNWVLITSGGLALFSLVADFITTAMGAGRFGASKTAIIGASLGTFAGLLFFPLGLIVGPFIGAFGGELYARKDLMQAGRAGFGTWIGLLVGSVLKVAIAFIMIALLIGSLIF